MKFQFVRMVQQGNIAPVGLGILTAAFVILSACAVNPVTGKKTISLMSEEQELALGAESDPLIVAEYGLYTHAGMQALIDARGKEMAAISHRPNLPFKFRILDSPVVNAFAVPGGYVYFTRGILAHFNNEAELAGVLGHEIGHITARHADEQYTKQVLAQVLMVGGMIVSKELRAFANETQQAVGLLFLKYSRDNETQSDALGVEYSTRIGYDAHEMAGFFNTLKKLSDEGGEVLPGFLSTHPEPANRVVRVGQLADEWQARDPQASYKINQDAYLRLLDGMVFGEDPRQGYVDGSVFYHPELKFSFPIPSNWKLANYPTQVRMVSDDGNALMLFTLAEGASLEAAAEKDLKDLGLQTDGTRKTTVNGLPALEVDSHQESQDQASGTVTILQVRSTFIQYEGRIYVFHAAAVSTRFAGYTSAFQQAAQGFRKLSDPARLNVRPDLLRIVPVKAAGTFEQALAAYQVPQTRRRELEILNQLEAGDRVEAGRLIKILGK